jgi:hypothetical protein
MVVAPRWAGTMGNGDPEQRDGFVPGGLSGWGGKAIEQALKFRAIRSVQADDLR